jgi:hypothetical protein
LGEDYQEREFDSTLSGLKVVGKIFLLLFSNIVINSFSYEDIPHQD